MPILVGPPTAIIFLASSADRRSNCWHYSPSVSQTCKLARTGENDDHLPFPTELDFDSTSSVMSNLGSSHLIIDHAIMLKLTLIGASLLAAVHE